MKKQKMKHHTEEKAAHELTAAERTALEKYLAGIEKRPMRCKVINNGSDITLDHPNPLVGRALIMSALGSADFDFVDGIVRQLISESRSDQRIDERKLNFLLSIVEGIEPKDQLEPAHPFREHSRAG
jgi:hypothetical protein